MSDTTCPAGGEHIDTPFDHVLTGKFVACSKCGRRPVECAISNGDHNPITVVSGREIYDKCANCGERI